MSTESNKMIIPHWQEGKKARFFPVCSDDIPLSVDWVLIFWLVRFYFSWEGTRGITKVITDPLISEMLNKVLLMQGRLFHIPNTPGMAQSPRGAGCARRGSSAGAGPLPFPAQHSQAAGHGHSPAGKGHGWGNAPSGSPGNTPALMLSDHPACAAAITGGTHGLRQKHPQHWPTEDMFLLFPLFLCPLSSWGLTGVPK